MGLFDGIKKALGGQTERDADRSSDSAKREIVQLTDWEIDGDEVIRGFRYRENTTGQEDKLIVAVNVQPSNTGGIVHVITLRIDPALTRQKQEVRFMLSPLNADVPPAVSPALIGIDDDGSNVVIILDRVGAKRVMAVLRAATPISLRMTLVDGTRYAREFPSDQRFLSMLKAREDQVTGVR